MSNVYLGEDKARDPKLQARVLALIEDINSEIALGTHGPRNLEGPPHVY